MRGGRVVGPDTQDARPACLVQIADNGRSVEARPIDNRLLQPQQVLPDLLDAELEQQLDGARHTEMILVGDGSDFKASPIIEQVIIIAGKAAEVGAALER